MGVKWIDVDTGSEMKLASVLSSPQPRPDKPNQQELQNVIRHLYNEAAKNDAYCASYVQVAAWLSSTQVKPMTRCNLAHIVMIDAFLWALIVLSVFSIMEHI